MNVIRNEPVLLTLLAALAVAAWSGYSLWRSAGVEAISGPRLADVLSGVKKEIRLAQEQSDLSALPGLSRVEVELEVLIAESREGSVSASVVSLEALGKEARARTESLTQKVKVALKPPRKSLTQEGVDLEGHPLARAIVEVAEDLAKSAETAPKLDVSSVEFSVKFVVTSSQTREGGFDLKVLSTNRKKIDSSQGTHQVKLVFAPPEDEKAPSWEEE